MTWRAITFAALIVCAGMQAQQGPAAALQRLARFIVQHYCGTTKDVTREVTFSAPLTGEPLMLLHFTWAVVARDQYGRDLENELSGFVEYDVSGDLRQLVASGSLTSADRLRHLRKQLNRNRKWPTRLKTIQFGPDTPPRIVSLAAKAAIAELIDADLVVRSATLRLMNASGHADGTWHVIMADTRTPSRIIEVRVEPFTGTIVQIDVCDNDTC
jgi:hypothetical protein